MSFEFIPAEWRGTVAFFLMVAVALLITVGRTGRFPSDKEGSDENGDASINDPFVNPDLRKSLEKDRDPGDRYN